MADPNLQDFQQRVARIAADRAQVRAFLAEGTRGLSPPGRAPRRCRPLLGPLAFVLCCGLGLKAALLAEVGPASYAYRVARLAQGDGIDRFAAALMQPDPVSRALGLWLQRILP